MKNGKESFSLFISSLLSRPFAATSIYNYSYFRDVRCANECFFFSAVNWENRLQGMC